MFFETEVARGAAWLDETVPRWEDRIDLGRFNLVSCDACVLGQLGGWGALGVTLLEEKGGSTAFYGFSIEEPFSIAEYAAYYKELTDTWRNLILRRRAMKHHPSVPLRGDERVLVAA